MCAVKSQLREFSSEKVDHIMFCHIPSHGENGTLPPQL